MGILDESSKILKLKELKLKCIHYFTLQGIWRVHEFGHGY